MKKYNIKVNGKVYEVEVELTGSEMGAQVQPQKSEAPAADSKPEPKPVKPQGTTGAVKITAPMPGTILQVNVKVGDKVEKGTIICVLEAMKMENEIPSPQDGTVSSVNVASGAAVESGALLISLN